MAAEEYVFDPQIDPTQIWGSGAAPLLEMVRTLVPNPYRGMIIVSSDPPATTGQPSGFPTDWYAWQKNCLWFNPTAKTIYGYVSGQGWVPANNVPPNTLSGTALTDGTVALSKINIAGIQNGTILYVNNSHVLAATSISNLLTDNCVIPRHLQSVIYGRPPGTYTYTSTPTTPVDWTRLDAVLLNRVLMVGDTGTLSPQVLEGDAAGTFLGCLGPDDRDFYDFNIICPDGGINIGKLYSGGAENIGKIPSVISANRVDWVPMPAQSPTKVTARSSAEYAIPAPGFTITHPHTHPTVPEIVTVRLVCKVADGSFSPDNGDEIDLCRIFTGNALQDGQCFGVKQDKTNVYVTRNSWGANSSALLVTTNQASSGVTAGSFVGLNTANWKVKITTTQYA